MGTLQKIERLAQSGDLKIEAEGKPDTNQIDVIEYWYKVIYRDYEHTQITGYDPTLKGAVDIVYSTLCHVIEKENMGGLWNS